jgi:hypothetical protein
MKQVIMYSTIERNKNVTIRRKCQQALDLLYSKHNGTALKGATGLLFWTSNAVE